MTEKTLARMGSVPGSPQHIDAGENEAVQPTVSDTQVSALPWSYLRDEVTGDSDLWCSDDYLIGQIGREANAAHIVQCVNLYPALLQQRKELLQALKELRELAAACFRVINVEGTPEMLKAEMDRLGIQDGAGTRAQAAIAKAEHP